MDIKLNKSTLQNNLLKICITGSKSESNRLLILQAFYPEIVIENLSNSDDTQLMKKALQSNENIVDIHHAGTAMRFLTAYFASKKGCEIILTGSSRMKQRPVRILVEALTELGADIECLENYGFPPLKIRGKEINKNKITLKANVSSQYISALLLVAPKLKNGLEITLVGEITSTPYIKMTLSLLDQIGVKTSFKNKVIKVKPYTIKPVKTFFTVESDWSSASYYYSLVALSNVGTEIEISSFKKSSLQGDSILSEIYKNFGVETEFKKNSIVIKKQGRINPGQVLEFNLINSPDLAQTIAVTALGLNVECKLNGLHTLKIKETDRLVALKTEIEKLGGRINITNDSLHVFPGFKLKSGISIATYNDHRMAMAFAPLCLITDLIIKNADVVSKSYPTFWEDMESLGISLNN